MDHIINSVVTLCKVDPWAIGRHRRVYEDWNTISEPPATLLKNSPLSGLGNVEVSVLGCEERVSGMPLQRRTSLHRTKGLSWHQDQSVKATGNWGKDFREIMYGKFPCNTVQLEGVLSLLNTHGFIAKDAR